MDEERRTAVPNAPRLAPEDIATRAFSSAFRGLSESEVRSFLKRIADEMTAAAHRERELRDSLLAAQQRADHREPLDESELLEALGEETAKLLRSAREAARDIRAKAEEQAARVRTEAADEAAIVRTEANELLELRRTEADTEIADLRAQIGSEIATQRSESEADIERLRADATAESEAQRETARVVAEASIEESKRTGRAMVEEAKALRERILADLGHRRGLLQDQIAELKSGREHLLDAYRTVKRTFLEATSALSEVEERAAENRPEPVDAATIAAAFDPAVVDDTAVDLGAELSVDEDLGEESAQRPELGDLFARIREQASNTTQDVESNPVAATIPTAMIDATETSLVPEAVPGDLVDERDEEPGETVATLVASVAKGAKRVVQDQQNEVLDALRRQKGRPQSEAVLAGDGAKSAWEATLREVVQTAFARGAGSDAQMPVDLVAALCHEIGSGLRSRLAEAIDSGDAEGVNDRVNARFREWKAQDLEYLLSDALHSAYVHGVFTSIPAGASARWVMGSACCADCADNSLESVLKGAEFPTGHVLPPAHAGCRCLITAAAD